MTNPLRVLARCFIIPCDERCREKKIIPPHLTFMGRRLEYEREIKSRLTGETIAYEQSGGNWIIDVDAQTREFRVSQGLWYPYAPSCGSL